MSINERLTEYGQARRALAEFDAEYGPLMEQRSLLEQAVIEAQEILTDTLTLAEIDFVEDQDFAITLVKQDRGAYLVERLPHTADVLDCCTMTITKTDVQKLVKKGVLTPEMAEAAWKAKPAKPFVRVTIKTEVGLT